MSTGKVKIETGIVFILETSICQKPRNFIPDPTISDDESDDDYVDPRHSAAFDSRIMKCKRLLEQYLDSKPYLERPKGNAETNIIDMGRGKAILL